MRNIITPCVLNSILPEEFEDWREGGEELRRELTHAVMRDIKCPEGWYMNGEYRSESGGFFPVQIRFTPPHGRFELALCSPGDISPVWIMVFLPVSGRFSVARTFADYCADDINSTLSLAARLDADGYASSSIVTLLMVEEAA